MIRTHALLTAMELPQVNVYGQAANWLLVVIADSLVHSAEPKSERKSPFFNRHRNVYSTLEK